MATDALPLPSDLQALLARHPGLDWQALALDGLRRTVAEVDRVEQLARRSRLRARDARSLARELREART